MAGAIAWFAFCYGGAVLGYLAVNAIAARLLVADFGQFVFAVTATTLLGQLGLMGAHRGGLREAARLTASDVEGMANLRRAVRAVSLTALPAFSLAAAAVTFYAYNDAPLLTRTATAASVGLLVWFGGQQRLLANYLRGFGQVRIASLLQGRSGGLLVSLCQAIFLAVVLLLAPQSQLSGALAGLAAGYAIPVAIAWRRVNQKWREIDAAGSILHDLKTVIVRNWHFASNQIAGLLGGTVEIWLAGLLLSKAELSYFSAAQRLSLLLAVPLVSLGFVYSPVVSRLFGKDDKQLEKLLRTGATVSAVVTACASIPLLFLPEFILTMVYGRWFADAGWLLVILTLGGVTTMLSGLSTVALTMSRHEAIVGYVEWIGVVVRIALGAAAAMFLGAIGLAASAAAITALLSFVFWALTRQRLGLTTHPTLKPELRLMFKTAA
jgi:O-antigen/teichoic acid export membrane protein